MNKSKIRVEIFDFGNICLVVLTDSALVLSRVQIMHVKSTRTNWRQLSGNTNNESKASLTYPVYNLLLVRQTDILRIESVRATLYQSNRQIARRDQGSNIMKNNNLLKILTSLLKKCGQGNHGIVSKLLLTKLQVKKSWNLL